MIFGILGIDKYLKKLTVEKASELIDFLTEFQNNNLGSIFFIESNNKIVKEFEKRHCPIMKIPISDENAKNDFYIKIRMNFRSILFLNDENLDTLFNIIGNDPKRIKKFADKFTKITDDSEFVYHNYYIKSNILLIKLK